MEDKFFGGRQWLFQGNPKRYDLKDKLTPNLIEPWLVTRYVTRIQPGDIVWFWRAVERALYGWGEVLEAPQPIPELADIRVKIRYEVRFDPPIGYNDIRNNSRLANMMVLRAPQGTNFAVASEEANALVELARAKGFDAPLPIPDAEFPAPFVPISQEVQQWLAPYWTDPGLVKPILQTVDMLAAIHDLSVDSTKDVPPFVQWLAKAFSGARRSDTILTEKEFKEPLRELVRDPWKGDKALYDAEISEKTAERLYSFGPVMSPELAESIDRTALIVAQLMPEAEITGSVDLWTPALLTALLFSDWPAVKHLLARLDFDKTIVQLREDFLAEIAKAFDEDAVPLWRPYTRIGAADLVVLSYAPDLAEGHDALNIEPDVKAFASVIASQRLTPPLSIGLFGDWGSGKSFFMRKLREQVEELAKSARVPDPAKPGKWIVNPESDFLPNIVQIEFNAWHYVESDLWASLVTHLFENLRVDAEDPAEVLQNRRNKLLSEMDTAAKLRANAEDERKAALKQLDRKRTLLSELQYQRSQQRIRRSFTEVLGALTEQSCDDLLTDTAKAALEQVKAGNFDKVSQAYDEFSRSAKDARSLFTRTGRIWRGLSELGWYNLIWLGGLLAAMLILGFALPVLVDSFGDDLESFLGALAALVSGGAVWLLRGVQKAGGALDLIESAQNKLSDAIAESMPPPGRDEEKIVRDLRDLENQVEIAETQVQQAAERAEALEAELVVINRTASLAHFIEQRAASGDYREQLGILALIRHDFEQLSKRMQDMRKSPLPLDDPSRIDRIVLYIDDLDRCPAERVFTVLQAIHLLLAFDAFVVVVGVDERWLTRALALARTGLLRRSESKDMETDKVLEDLNIRPGDTARPADFLEKIFQVAFWLRPMGKSGFERLLDSMLRLDQMRLGAMEDGPFGTAATQQPAEDGKAPPKSVTKAGVPPDEEASLGMGNEPEQAGDITNARPEAVAITPKEAEVMRALAPILGRSPRTAKRFVNIYRVLKAREYIASALNPLLEAESLGGMALLALVTGHPRGTGQVLDAIEAAPANQLVTEFMVWGPDSDPGEQGRTGLARFKGVLPGKIGRGIADTATKYLGDLQMRDLQRWLPTVRRFSFRSEIARDTSYTK